jgi:hypothetical protein
LGLTPRNACFFRTASRDALARASLLRVFASCAAADQPARVHGEGVGGHRGGARDCARQPAAGACAQQAAEAWRAQRSTQRHLPPFWALGAASWRRARAVAPTRAALHIHATTAAPRARARPHAAVPTPRTHRAPCPRACAHAHADTRARLHTSPPLRHVIRSWRLST